MAEVERLPRPAPAKDIYDPDDVRLRDSPPLRAMEVNLAPPPSSPLVAPGFKADDTFNNCYIHLRTRRITTISSTISSIEPLQWP